MTSTRCCLLFSKPAEPGRVKTRLHPVLSPGEAAELHQAFLDDLIPRLGAGEFDFRLAWALNEGEEMPTSSIPGVRQQGRDLGERLYDALSRFAASHEMVAAVGSDHPELTAGSVEEAFNSLQAGADIVLGPAEDGGYYLVALRRAAVLPELFQSVSWGTHRVLEQTLEACRSLDLRVEFLARAHDVDRPEDLDRLALALATRESACPNTARVLRRLGHLT